MSSLFIYSFARGGRFEIKVGDLLRERECEDKEGKTASVLKSSRRSLAGLQCGLKATSLTRKISTSGRAVMCSY